MSLNGSNGRQSEPGLHWEVHPSALTNRERPLNAEVVKSAFTDNFYLKTMVPPEKQSLLVPNRDIVWVEITGLPGSGKHTIYDAWFKMAKTSLGLDKPLVNEAALLEYQDMRNTKERAKDAPDDPTTHPLDGYNTFVTRLHIWDVMDEIMRNKCPWSVYTVGPFGAFQMFLQTQVRSGLQGELGGVLREFVSGFSEVLDLVNDTSSVTELAQQMPDSLYTLGLHLLTAQCNAQDIVPFVPVPTIDSPIPILAISGLSPRQCLINMKDQTSTRTIARTFGTEWRPEQLFMMRFVQGLMMKTTPDTVFEVNTEVTDGVAEMADGAATAIFNKSAEIVRAYGHTVVNPLDPTVT